MALIKFDSMLDHLQSPHSLPSELLSGQEGLHYGDMCYMPLQCTLKMQHVPYNYFINLVWENNFQPVGTTMDDASNTTAMLLVFVSDDQLKTIEYVHIGLVVCHAGCQLYELRSIPCFIQSIDDDLKRTREKLAASGHSGKVHSLMAVPTYLPYCLMCTLTSTLPLFPMRTSTISTSRVALLGDVPMPASAMPCFSMSTCLRPTGGNTMGVT